MTATTTAPDRSSANQPASGKPANGSAKRKKILLIIGSIFIAAAIVAGLYWILIARYVEETEDAYVQGNVVQVTPQIAGSVNRIYAEDTDIVKAGQPLVGFDPADMDLALKQAEAQLAQTVREVRTLYAAQAQSGANLRLREAELKRARDDLMRRQGLAGSGAVSGEEIRHAELAVSIAQAAAAVAKEQLVSGRALTEGTSIAQHPNVRRAAARVEEALLARSRATLYAPVAGQIAKRNVQIGQRVNPGAPLMAIVPLDRLWVEANFKESQLHHIRIGQPVTLTADLYGSKIKYDGKITGLAAGTGSAFALLPAQNATGNWIKVVQRVPVRIELNAEQLVRHPLRIGLSIQANVDLHQQDGALPRNRMASSSSAAAYQAAIAPADADIKTRIDAIIAANLK